MKRFYLASVSAGFALALMGSPLAMAQDAQHNNNGSSHNKPNTHVQSNNVASHKETQHGTQPNTRVVNHGAPSQPNAHVENHAAPMQGHGAPVQQRAAASHQWHNGDHYSGNRTVVDNWSHYHLRQPPSGYEWVQDNNQFVLIAITSGVIASIIVAASQ
jgi:Ni/Co efflux regulator RcnB